MSTNSNASTHYNGIAHHLDIYKTLTLVVPAYIIRDIPQKATMKKAPAENSTTLGKKTPPEKRAAVEKKARVPAEKKAVVTKKATAAKVPCLPTVAV